MLILPIVVIIALGLLFPWVNDYMTNEIPQLSAVFHKLLNIGTFQDATTPTYAPVDRSIIMNRSHETTTTVIGTLFESKANDLAEDLHELLHLGSSSFKDFLDDVTRRFISHDLLDEAEERFGICSFCSTHQDLIICLLVVAFSVLALKIVRTLAFCIFGSEDTMNIEPNSNNEFSKISEIEREYVKSFETIPMCKTNYDKEEQFVLKLYEELGKSNDIGSTSPISEYPTSIKSGSNRFDLSKTNHPNMKSAITSSLQQTDDTKENQSPVSLIESADEITEISEDTSHISTSTQLDITVSCDDTTSSLSSLTSTSHGLSKQLVYKNASSVLKTVSTVQEKNDKPTLDVTQETVYINAFSKNCENTLESYLT